MKRQLLKTRHVARIFAKDIAYIALSVALIFSGAATLWLASFRIPDLSGFEERKVTQSTKIYDRTGEVLLYDVFQNMRRTIVPSERISRNIKNAVVAIEDPEFYEHYGIKPKAIVRAVWTNLVNAELLSGQGGSTITQQVVKLTILTTEKRISRKLKEWVLAIQLDKSLPKEKILELYLNEVPYGGSLYGIEEAAKTFFGTSAEEVSVAQAAYLAAIPNAPTYYSPYGNNREALEARKDLVLRRMLERGFVTEEEYNIAKAEKVEFKPQERLGLKAPHFVAYVREYLENKYGENALAERGLIVKTTLDWKLQEKAEQLVKDYAIKNEVDNNAENASVVAVDPRTGAILTMVGSRDFFDKEIDGAFNIAVAKRQPGSSFKPVVYATAFMKGYTPDTHLFDVPTQFSSSCDAVGKPLIPGVSEDECYMPVNYDGNYRGPISLRNALAQSLNVPAVKTLYLAGVSDSLRTARDLGITSLNEPDRYGLTLVLGGGEVSLLELTGAYGVFANDGMRLPPTPILSITDNTGVVLEEFSPRPVQAIPVQTAREISDILSDSQARAPAFGLNSPLAIPGRQVAAKTGTTNDYRDAWIIGYTPSIALGAWAGNNDNSPMEKKVAGFIIAPLWNAVMQEALKNLPDERFPAPAPVSTEIKPVLRGFWNGNDLYEVDRISGKLATEYTPAETREERVVTDVHSILYWVDKKDPLGPQPTDPFKDSQFALWEQPIIEWLKQNPVAGSPKPILFDDIHVPEKMPTLAIVSPSAQSTITSGAPLSVSIAPRGIYPIVKAEYFLNGSYIGSSLSPFRFSFVPDQETLVEGVNQLRVVIYDSVYNQTEATVELRSRN